MTTELVVQRQQKPLTTTYRAYRASCRQRHEFDVLVPLVRSAVTLLRPLLQAREDGLRSSRRQCSSLIFPVTCSGPTPGAPGIICGAILRGRSTGRRCVALKCVALSLWCFCRADLRSMLCSLGAPGCGCLNTGTDRRPVSGNNRACPPT